MAERAAVHRAQRAGLLGIARLSHLWRPVARAALHGRFMSEATATQSPWQMAKIIRIEKRTPRVTSFFFKLSRPFAHQAGQYVDVRLTAPDGYQARRSYSIASAPESGGTVELAIERLED